MFGVCADLGQGVMCCCGPQGSGVAAMAQLSQCKASKHLQTDTVKVLCGLGINGKCTVLI